MSTVQTWVADFTARGQGLTGANIPWLAAMRKRAIDRFASEGWPTTKQENWRHTSLASLEQQSFLPAGQASVADKVMQVRASEPGHWLVFTDGRFDPALSDIGDLPSGAQVQALSVALEHSPDALQDLLGDETQGASTAALNLALASDGAVIRLARGVELEKPVHLVFIAASEQAASFPRNLIQAEAGSRGVVVEHYLGQGSGASLTNTVTRAQLAADAHVTHLKLQHEDEQAVHLGAIDVVQGKGSVYNSHSMSFGARLARHDIATDFTGDHCETLFNGLYYVNGRRHVDHHTLIGHSMPHCISREYYRGVLADTARGVFSGRILVAPGADKTDAVQRSDSLLLSRMAKADARPELEIYADDVKCAHGATVGQIDEDSLFYLRTRGLDESSARSVLTYAFAAEAVARIEPEVLRRRIIGAIRSLAPNGLDLGEFA
ncbi:Fe-S cluster assembly protein SufD [Pollutimonas harenae]|uniref:Fe-S cluster assembly protein SufD n=1 Tax=Pollutimonas harenae TaxID=657015 RepID=A0A853GYW4_9BURK|nr:Fe-S cluster assembly protein SufD [Pollutimonas harenae]NYT85916.1 Fe-S cluster assembly protein SufD [Pollutimonas harenae]TEA70968.1 Fe-S cluster assembly protein SufD [Pollutimonas harenae]